jgi:hypothetical protein
MKKLHICEAIAAGAGLIGAIILVAGFMPIINPQFVDVNETSNYSPRMAFLLPTLFSLPILGLAWHFNKKAQLIRREVAKSTDLSKKTWERHLKWIVAGAVILLGILAYLI